LLKCIGSDAGHRQTINRAWDDHVSIARVSGDSDGPVVGRVCELGLRWTSYQYPDDSNEHGQEEWDMETTGKPTPRHFSGMVQVNHNSSVSGRVHFSR